MEELLSKHLFATHAIAASGSVVIGEAATYPLDTIKTIIQVGSASGNQLTPSQAFNRVRVLSGYLGFYKGLAWLTLARILGTGVRFGVYEILAAFCKDGREGDHVYVSEALMAGVVAGALESVVSSPFEIIKLRLQVISASRIQISPDVAEKRAFAPTVGKLLHGYTPETKALNKSVDLLSVLPTKHLNMARALSEYPWTFTGSGRPPSVCNVARASEIVSLEGWGALWRGLRAGIARDSVFGGVFFSSWQFLHSALLAWKAVGMDPSPRFDEEAGPLSPLALSITAGLSGTVAAAASHCFDTAKSRAQCIVLPKYVAMERKLLGWRRPGNSFERATGIHPADRSLLFRGIWLRMARSGLASFAIVGGYFMAVDHLVPR